MTTSIKRRRGTTTQTAIFTGAVGETTVDTTKQTVVVHDGATAGGFPLATEANLALKASIASPTFTGTVSLPAVSLAGTVSGGGNQINNVIIGASTPLAGSFTTLTTSSTVTLSGGTANGVAYLNGSKVLTSGSALTFDGATLNVGIGGVGKVQIGTASSGTFQTGLYASNGVDTDFQVRFKTGVSEFGTSTATPLAFSINGSEQMRLTSTGLGIGTASPSVKLHSYTSGNTPILSETSGGVTSYLGMKNTGGMAYIASQNNNILFTTSSNADLRMTLDSSGNLGLGVTPSAWGGYGNIQLYAGGGLALSGYDQSLGVNYYSNSSGAYKYTSAGPAVRQAMYNGQYVWNIAPSGTAGAAIAFTQAMTLDASGNLLVGTTSTTAPNPGFSVYAAGAGNTQAIIGHSTSSGSGQSYVVFAYNSGNIGSITQAGTTAVLYNTTSDYRLKIVIGPVADAGSRIDSLQPLEYEWKADGARTRGFLAHQFQEVYAGSVTGTKDAVDEDGKPKYQAMQASSSEVIADLVAEIQSLRKRLAAAGI